MGRVGRRGVPCIVVPGCHAADDHRVPSLHCLHSNLQPVVYDCTMLCSCSLQKLVPCLLGGCPGQREPPGMQNSLGRGGRGDGQDTVTRRTSYELE